MANDEGVHCLIEEATKKVGFKADDEFSGLKSNHDRAIYFWLRHRNVWSLSHRLTYVESIEKHLDACTLAEHLARTDPVTGLFKRGYFEYRTAGSGFIVLCDLVDLKTINDHKGLAAGDALLTQVAKIVSAKVRSADLVARLDGGLLAVWCSDADASSAEVIRKRLCAAIDAQITIQTRILPSPPSFEGQWWKET